MQQKNTTPVSYQGKHVFTTEEKEQKSQQMLAAMREKEEIEAEFKTSKSNYKSKIDAKEGEIKLVANLLMAGFENRTYSCILTKNFDEGRREYHELGSGKLIGTEPLTASDYQTQLQIDEDAIRANNEAADKLAEEQVGLAPEEIEKAEEDPAYTVEPDSNPLEMDFEETLAEEPKVIDKPTEQKGEAKQRVETKQEPKESLEDPFGMEESNDGENDPFSFDDI